MVASTGHSRAWWFTRATYGVFAVLVFVAVSLLVMSALRFPARSTAGECRSNLKGLCTAELVLFQEQRRFTTRFREAGWDPERGNKYSYFLSADGKTERRRAYALDLDEDASNVAWDEYKYRPMGQVFGPAGPLPTRFAGDVPLGLSGRCPDCSLVMVCAADLHRNTRLDIWSISTAERKLSDGTVVQACQPYHERDGITPADVR